MTQDVALLQLPDGYMAREFVHDTLVYGANQMEAYARACVEANVTGLRDTVRISQQQAIDALRLVEITQASAAEAEARSERLEEALRELFDDYKRLADSGDAGFWRLEDTYAGKKALAALTPNAAQPGETTPLDAADGAEGVS